MSIADIDLERKNGCAPCAVRLPVFGWIYISISMTQLQCNACLLFHTRFSSPPTRARCLQLEFTRRARAHRKKNAKRVQIKILVYLRNSWTNSYLLFTLFFIVCCCIFLAHALLLYLPHWFPLGFFLSHESHESLGGIWSRLRLPFKCCFPSHSPSLPLSAPNRRLTFSANLILWWLK